MNTKIKICGLTTVSDIELVNRLGVDFAGFVLYFPKSKRNITIERAREFIAKLNGIKSVAVVVAPTAEQVKEIAAAGFDYIQIHGELTEEAYEACGLPILRAFNVSNMSEFGACERYSKIKGYVFDAAEPGSGKTFDWKLVGGLPRDGKIVLLAGGLNSGNVGRAIEEVKPDGVDVSSGVEKPEGGKDEKLAEEFVKAVREK
jgi:phosphoribosylanthranilate isomerase